MSPLNGDLIGHQIKSQKSKNERDGHAGDGARSVHALVEDAHHQHGEDG